MWIGILFAFLGVFGSALPGHLGMRVLAHREQLDRQIPFAPGTEHSGLAYAWWLMRFKQAQYPQAKYVSISEIVKDLLFVTQVLEFLNQLLDYQLSFKLTILKLYIWQKMVHLTVRQNM